MKENTAAAKCIGFLCRPQQKSSFVVTANFFFLSADCICFYSRSNLRRNLNSLFNKDMASKIIATATVRAVKGRKLIPTRAALTLVSDSVYFIRSQLVTKSLTDSFRLLLLYKESRTCCPKNLNM